MRFFVDFNEAKSEIKRDLKEMGLRTHTKTMQDKDISLDTNFETYELLNYIYTIVDYTTKGLEPVQPWANLEFEERMQGVHGSPVNPGEAWKTRADVWEEFLEVPTDNDGKEIGPPRFSYTYSQRFNSAQQFDHIANRLRIDPLSRQLYASVWQAHNDIQNLGTHRVPCSLGYLFQCRHGKLNVTYFMRSCDLFTHYDNDCYLAIRLRDRIAEWVGLEPGTFTHYIGSFHVYQKDVEEVF